MFQAYRLNLTSGKSSRDEKSWEWNEWFTEEYALKPFLVKMGLLY